MLLQIEMGDEIFTFESFVKLRRVGGVNTIRNQLTTTADGFGRQFGN